MSRRPTTMRVLFAALVLTIASKITLGSDVAVPMAVPFRREIPAHALKTNLERQRVRTALRAAATANSAHSRANTKEKQTPRAQRQASLARCYSPEAWRATAGQTATTTTGPVGWSLRGTSAAQTPSALNASETMPRTLDSVDTPFVSCLDIIYYGEIQLGSDLQPLQA